MPGAVVQCCLLAETLGVADQVRLALNKVRAAINIAGEDALSNGSFPSGVSEASVGKSPLGRSGDDGTSGTSA